jgi:hypothetical protein
MSTADDIAKIREDVSDLAVLVGRLDERQIAQGRQSEERTAAVLAAISAQAAATKAETAERTKRIGLIIGAFTAALPLLGAVYGVASGQGAAAVPAAIVRAFDTDAPPDPPAALPGGDEP